jgi:hypothetical protein
VVEANGVRRRSEVGAPLTRESDKAEAVSRIIEEAEISVEGEEGDTEMISRNATATHRYKSSPTGLCWRRLIFLV